jgi:superfamily II DNA or RNA helicase
MPVTLRDYQADTLDAIQFQWQRGYHSTLAELFTSAGKTVIFVEYVKRHINLTDKRVLVMTPAHLILQTKLRFLQFYAEFEGYTNTGITQRPTLGVEMAEFTEPQARLVIGSVPTVIDRVPSDFELITPQDLTVLPDGGIVKSATSKRKVLISRRVDEILRYGMIDEIIFDEAHHAVAPGGFLLINRLWDICRALDRPLTRLIGFTATAFRDDGVALSNLFQTICIRRNQKWAETHGFVAPLKDPIRVHAQIPMGKEDILKTDNWATSIVQAWQEKGENRPTFAYLPNVAASRALNDAFRDAGIASAHVDSNTTIDIDGSVHDKDYRDNILNKVVKGECKIVNNYGVFLEGTDCPPVSCMIWARETDNVVLTTQAIGRIIRLFDGNDYLPAKQDALIIDVTAGDLTVLTAGTLAGYRIDPLTGLYQRVEDDEAEVETLVDGRDIRDTQKGVITSSGLIYSIGKLIRKSGSDWYHDERFDVLSLGVSDNETLIIVPPFYTLATLLGQVLSAIEESLETSFSQEKYKEYANVDFAKQMFENYTLWHYKKGETPKEFVHKDVSLDRLMDFAVPYMNDVTDLRQSYVSKSSSWKRKPMSDAQKKFLTNLCNRHRMEIDSHWTQGDASQIISHLLSFNENVRLRIGQIYKSMQRYING